MIWRHDEAQRDWVGAWTSGASASPIAQQEWRPKRPSNPLRGARRTHDVAPGIDSNTRGSAGHPTTGPIFNSRQTVQHAAHASPTPAVNAPGEAVHPVGLARKSPRLA